MAALDPAAALPDAGSQTRERLLDAAESLFAERGYAATSVRDITAEAGCNVAAVNYHFGGKDSLYHETFRRRLSALREIRVGSIRGALATAGVAPTLEAVLRGFAEAFFDPLIKEASGTHFLKMISWELLDPRLPPETFAREMMEPVTAAFIEALAITCPGLEERAARRCAHSVIGQLAHVVQVQRCLGPAAARDIAGLGRDEVVDHVVRFSAAGVRACQR